MAAMPVRRDLCLEIQTAHCRPQQIAFGVVPTRVTASTARTRAGSPELASGAASTAGAVAGSAVHASAAAAAGGEATAVGAQSNRPHPGLLAGAVLTQSLHSSGVAAASTGCGADVDFCCQEGPSWVGGLPATSASWEQEDSTS